MCERQVQIYSARESHDRMPLCRSGESCGSRYFLSLTQGASLLDSDQLLEEGRSGCEDARLPMEYLKC